MTSLNKQQQAAVRKVDGPCIILAGAGTGKSLTLVEKVNYLLNEVKKCSSNEVLCLTFSNEATNSLSEKIQSRIGSSSPVTVKTFHSFCADILREDGHLIDVDEGFEILLPDDARILVHKYLDVKPYWADRYVLTIQAAKDFDISLDDLKEYFGRIRTKITAYAPENELREYANSQRLKLQTLHLKRQTTAEEKKQVKEEKKSITEFLTLFAEYESFRKFIEIWGAYDQLKKEKNLLDYSDLNHFALILFRQFGAQKYVKQYRYVLVDEFQDTNKLQFELLEFIASHRNITVVGDPNQSIYGFRGAYRESFNHFKQAFDVNNATDVFNLDQSYRSPDRVLDISHELIKNNYSVPSECVPIKNAAGITGDKVRIVELVKAAEEARYIADIVEKAILDGVPKTEICILHRTHKQAVLIKQALDLKKIPVISAGKTNLLQRREIRTATAYLSILSNLFERSGTGEQSWWDLFHYQNALSPSDSVKIGRYLKDNKNQDMSIDQALLTSVDNIDLSDSGKKIVARVASKLKELSKASNRSLPDLILDIYELSGLNRAFTHERTVGNVESLMNLKRFYDLAANYYDMHGKKITDFIEYLEIIDALGVDIEASKILQVDAVRLMTIHAVKGLEFDLVIVTNMVQDRFPLTRVRHEYLIPKELLPDLKAEIASWGEISDDERERRIKKYEQDILLYEERRLCYVAWTRAKKNLILTYARSYDEEPNSAKESIFLDEIQYHENPNCEFIQDHEETSAVIAPSSGFEQYKSLIKEQLVKSLDTDNLDEIMGRLASYLVCREGKVIDFKAALSTLSFNEDDLSRHLLRCSENKSMLIFNPQELTFSPSSIIDYEDCPKRFELRYLYQMPQRGDFDEEGTGATTGSFIHQVLEEGVKAGYATKEEFINHAQKLISDPEWKGVDPEDARFLIEVFWERNKGKYDKNSLTELKLSLEVDGYKFNGYADRVDILKDGSAGLIDYKTNANSLPPRKRAIQLGFYAIALQKMGYKISKLTLEMLRLEKPVEMNVDPQGNVTSSGREAGFTLQDVKNELIQTAKSIANDYEHEFKTTDNENNCKYCGYKFYCPKWG